MTDRDELARLIFEVPSEDPACVPSPRALADAILAAGYRKPRTITTVEELDELPNDTALRDAYGHVAVIYKGKLGDRPYLEVQYAGTEEMDSHYGYIALPATVLYVPGEQS